MISLEKARLSQGPASRSGLQAHGGKKSKIRIFSLMLILGLVMILACPALLFAEVEGFPEPPEENMTFSVMPVYQFPSSVDGGGDLGIFSLYAYADFAKQFNEKLAAGIGLHYQFDNYEFSGLTAFPVAQPWKEVMHTGISIPIFYTVNDKWEIVLIPQGQFSGEFDAKFGDSLVYGGGAGVKYAFTPDIRLGAGVAAYYYLEEARVFPFLIIDVQLSGTFNRFSISNPFHLSPAGPAGVIVSYQLNRKWDIGVGGGIRSSRFRLDDRGPIPNGIGEYTRFPLFARLSYKPVPEVTMALYGGLSIYNRLRVEDRHGDELYESGQDVAPLIGGSIYGKF